MNDFSKIKDVITSSEELKAMLEPPHEHVVKKTITHIDPHIAGYLAMSSIFFLATSALDGRTDVSPRGDKLGFVKVLDERRLVFPDRMGNRRIDSLLNIVENPQMGMIFLIPGLEEVLRINGRAIITRSEEFIASMRWDGKTTGLAVVVEVEECFIHCPRAFKQAGMWNAENWFTKEELPSVNEMFRAHLVINGVSL
ncbi:pyridoxamine 5'-phosphate oxidase family protein [Paenibacillus psychroresistens]|uniref:Pyridoxamine 5'-phosphate oxidase family protein n=2 Tax=Paenibacillus psychroresistens TaxID=1778678 RepID=A0A6B8RN54_9BACL|nr:pyridoxamine 5'-phosphate oxidase family protein [Paenibacillus psychroresistens]